MRGKTLFTLIAALASPAAAQVVDSTGGTVAPARVAIASPPVAAGELVRVWAPRARLDAAIANFARLDSNLVITGQSPNPEAPPREWVVRVDDVQRLEVYRGKPRSKARVFAGGVLGAAAGAAVGAGLTRFIECGGACDKSGSTKPFASPWLGAKIGAPIGALLGGVIAGMKHPRWEAVTLSIR